MYRRKYNFSHHFSHLCFWEFSRQSITTCPEKSQFERRDIKKFTINIRKVDLKNTCRNEKVKIKVFFFLMLFQAMFSKCVVCVLFGFTINFFRGKSLFFSAFFNSGTQLKKKKEQILSLMSFSVQLYVMI